jgi:ribosomal protein S18 acetylase RimI-like enzyme
MWESSPARDPDGWWLLTVDGVDAAICLLDESRADIGDGYVAVLGVRRQFRGRGLAQLLLRRAFVHYRDLGRAGTQLGVDAENLTGAVRLYEGVGMSAVRSVQGHALELA